MICTAFMKDDSTIVFHCKDIDSFCVPVNIDIDQVMSITCESEGGIKTPRLFYGINPKTRKILGDYENIQNWTNEGGKNAT